MLSFNFILKLNLFEQIIILTHTQKSVQQVDISIVVEEIERNERKKISWDMNSESHIINVIAKK